jgi:hypothetical protein
VEETKLPKPQVKRVIVSTCRAGLGNGMGKPISRRFGWVTVSLLARELFFKCSLPGLQFQQLGRFVRVQDEDVMLGNGLPEAVIGETF